jgi:DMSO/TMAO reductase YedYZ molybdopterin-dependent catalytic subunit
MRLAAFVVLATCLFIPTASGQDKPRLLTARLEVAGAVQRPLSLTPENLRAIAERHGGVLSSGALAREVPEAYRNYAGVRLTDVLNDADMRTDERNALRRAYVVATASDGYKAVFSWGELFNSPTGRGVLIVFERDGKPLGDGEGRLALVSMNDTRMGPRHVKWLSRVDVLRVPE